MSEPPSIRDIYNKASEGLGTPDVIITVGSVLNELLKTDEFNPDVLYRISENQIEEMT
jgi:hypothetical protein